jgi:hypothetical protein
MAAKFTEYPAGHLELRGSAWPWRPTALLAFTFLLSTGFGLLVAFTVTSVVRRIRRRREAGTLFGRMSDRRPWLSQSGIL